MTAQRIGVVVNPVGDPDTAEELIDRLKATADVSVVETTEEDPGKGMTQDLVAHGHTIVVSAGGDGTVRACAEALAGTEVPLVVLPLGTGNLLAGNLDLPHSVEGVVDVVFHGVDVEIDVGRANGEAFLVMAGFGLDTTIMDDTGQDAKDRVGPLAYVMTALAHLGDEPVSATLTIGDDPPSEMAVATCMAGNMGRVLGSLDVFPDAVWDDGELDILAITAEGLAEWSVAAGETLTSVEEGKHLTRWRSPPGRDPIPVSHAVSDRRGGPGRSRADRPRDRTESTEGEKGWNMIVTHVPETQGLEGEDAAAIMGRVDRWQLLRDSAIRFRYADGFSYARAVAFQTVLTLIPATIVAIAAAALIGDAALQNAIRELIRTVTPGAASDALFTTFEQGEENARGDVVALVAGGVTAAIGGATTMSQIQRGASRIYGVLDDRPTVKRYLVATALMVSVGILMVLGFIAVGFGSSVGGQFGDELASIWAWLRWPGGGSPCWRCHRHALQGGTEPSPTVVRLAHDGRIHGDGRLARADDPPHPVPERKLDVR